MRSFFLPSGDYLPNQTNKQVGSNEWNCQLAQCRKRVGCIDWIGCPCICERAKELRARRRLVRVTSTANCSLKSGP